jgi:hypothetical protein
VDEVAERAGRRQGEVAATAAVYVRLAGGAGRVMGDYRDVEVVPVQGSAADIAGQLTAMADAGVTHLQLTVDPITLASIDALGEVLAEFDRSDARLR